MCAILARRPALALVSLLAALACAAPPSDAPPVPASGLHRVQAAGAAADALVAAGATVVADYGGFRVLDAAPAALLGLADGPGFEYRDAYLRIALNSGDLDTSVPARAGARRVPVVGAAGKALHLLQFAGPVRGEWLARLEATGARVVSYVPWNAYLVYGDAAALERVHGLAAGRDVQFDGPYLPAHKLDRALGAASTGSYAVQLVEDPAVNEETLALASSLARRPGPVTAALGYVNLVVHADPAAVDALAARPDVVSIQPWSEPRLRDERQDMILAGQLSGGLPTGPGYLAWLAARGFTQAQFDASGLGVDVSDSGIDNASTAPNHFGLYRQGAVTGTSRVAYARLEGTPNSGSTTQGCDGHGNINAHIIAGYSDLGGFPFADAQGYRFGLGVAPFVRVGSSVVFDPNFTYPDYEDLISRASADGMRISSNSWGASTSSYGSDCQRYDALVRDAQPDGSAWPAAGNQPMVVVFAAGNDGPGAGSVGMPGNAKNVLSAGASENVHPFGGADGCGVGDTGADGALDVASFSSRGPAADGRIRPDLLAPGTHVTGGVAQAPGQRASPPAVTSGDANACFVATGVCGGVGSDFFPAGQEWYTASTGTSHSTPAIAGAAALVRQWFLNQGQPAPSPAMTKAFLMNAARYMTGAGANDSLYSNGQGMGLLDLGAAFDDTPRTLHDQEAGDLLTASGQTRTYSSAVGDPSRPFRVTLAWTDAPGATFGSAWKNDLDLTVQVGATVYKGNVFSGASSAPGGSADAKNNVESVFLPAGTTGPYTVTVTAASVNSDGVPGNASALDQDFALVISNGCSQPRPDAPGGLTAAATADNQITVGWTPNGAETYLVSRATAAGGPYAVVASVAGPPWVDGSRSGGSTFHYVVRAQRGCAVSSPSAEASATATGACLLPPAFAGLQSATTTGDELCGNALAWSPATTACGGALTYDVFRSTADGFVPDAANRIATGVAETGLLDAGGLVGGTAYHYVVRAVETSGAATVDDGNTVQRSATPSHDTALLRDDFDANRPPAGAAWWTESAPTGSDQLTLVPACRWHSASTAYRFGQAGATCGGGYANSTQNLLVLGGDGSVSAAANGIALPAGAGATLTFRVWYAFEAGYDGAYLAWSTSGPTGPFVAVPDVATTGSPFITSGGYDRWFSAGGRTGWSGTAASANGAFKEVVVDLGALAGQRIWLAWRFGSDSVVPAEGFYLDDVRLDVRDPACTSCATPPPPPPAGVTAAATADNEVTVSWAAGGAGSYDVHRAVAAGGSYALLGNVTAPPFVDTTVSGGVTYHYVVRARQGCARSTASAEAAVTATGACLLPPSFAGLAAAATTGGMTCGNLLTWEAATPSCGGTLGYDVFRGATAGFVPGPSNRIATGVAGTAFVDSGTLVGGTTYHYVVRATETSGAGTVSELNTVERSAAPRFVSLSFSDDFDGQRPPAAAAWWIERSLSGPEQLQLASGCHYQSATTAYRFGQTPSACGGLYASSTQNLLVLGGDGSAGPNGILIPPGGGSTLGFRLWYQFENYYDGASLAWSTTGPTGTFTPVPDTATAGSPYIVQGGYDGTLWAGTRGWTGQANLPNGALKPVLVNLDALAGQTVWFGWRFTTDGSVESEGLYLDDVVLDGSGTACSTIPVPPGTPTRYQLSGLPGTVTAGVPVAVTLTALDSNGQVSTGYSGPATLSSSDPAAVLPAPVSFASGIAIASVELRTAGLRSLTVTDGATPSLTASGFATVLGGPAAQLSFAQAPGGAVAGVSISPAIQVAAVDAFGNPASALVSLALGQNPGGDVLGGITSAVTTGGLATFADVQLVKAASGYTLVASSAGAPPQASAPFGVTAGPPQALAFAQEPAGAVAGVALSPAPTVEIRDGFGNRCASAAIPVTVSLAVAPAGATLSGPATEFSSAGVAAFPGLLVDRAGPGYQLLAFNGQLSSAVSAPFAAVAGAPHRALFVEQPGDVLAGIAFDPPVSALLLDAFDNPSLASTALVSLTLASNPSLAVLQGETTVAAVGGVVTFPGMSIDRAGLAFALYVGASGLHGDTSVGFDVAAGPVTEYAIMGPQYPPVGVEVSYVVFARDQFQNAQPGYVGSATASSSDLAAALPGQVPFTGGQTAPVPVTFRTAGAQTLTFRETTGGATGTLEVEVGGTPALAPAGGGGGCGCGSGGAGSSGLLLALAALLRRRAGGAVRARRAS